MNFQSSSLKKQQNENEFGGYYEAKSQIVIAGTKHTVTTDTNKVIHRKLKSKPLSNLIENPLSRQRENGREPDGRFTLTPFLPVRRRGRRKGTPQNRKQEKHADC